MSPERVNHRLSRGVRQEIRGLKKEFRGIVDLTNVTEVEKRRAMEHLLERSLPGEYQSLLANGRDLIFDWFKTCLVIRSQDACTREEAGKDFIKNHPREEIIAVSKALAVITQTFSK